MIDVFIEKLANRLNNENDLSDITWAVAEASPYFKEIFFEYFFSGDINISKIKKFKREHSSNNCRPDFYIEIDDRKYIIECKVNDRNHHFDDYYIEFSGFSKGYITNYNLQHEKTYDFVIKTWDDFRKYLKSKLNTAELEIFDRTLIQSYSNYIQHVCSINELQKMKLNDLTSLAEFNNLVEKTIDGIKGYNCKIYKQYNGFNNYRSGRYFYLNKFESSVNLYPWLGVWYCGKVSIYLEFSESSCRKLFQSFDETKAIDGITFYKPEIEDDNDIISVNYYLKEELFDEFNMDATGVERQRKIIDEFVKDVLLDIDRFLDWEIIPSIDHT